MAAKRKTGTYVTTATGGEEVRAFVPKPLPPTRPKLQVDEALERQLSAAQEALARLELAGAMVPSVDWFVYAFARKEAVLSSQIEGTQATLEDLLSFEAGGDPDAEAAELEEVVNVLEALRYAREQLADPKGLPLSVRLLNEMHERLLRGARGADKHPGTVRRTQNWVGGARPGSAVFVPPPPHTLAELLGDLEQFLHAEATSLPSVVRAGLAHVQFETIHPYLDGNGRMGRLLITLLLEEWGILSRPLLYLSVFFKKNRLAYYERLEAVRTEGDWEGWMAFFLRGVESVANEAVETIRALFALISRDRQRVLEAADLSVAGARLLEQLPSHPFVSVASVVQVLGVTKPTAGRAIETLVQAGVLTEVTGRKRDRLWQYREYLALLKVGTEVGMA